jgi:DNA-binding SARP family transcriptional activator
VHGLPDVIEVRLLGPPDVRIDGAAAPRMLIRHKNLTLFVYLACAGKRGRSQDQLIGVLWPDKSQAKARRSVTVALHTLRTCLGPNIVITEGGQSWIDPAALRLDIDQLDALMRAGKWHEANALIATDAGFLEGFGSDVSAYEDWLGTERRIWNRRIVDVRLHVAEEELRAGNARGAIVAAQQARRIDRLSEPAVMVLMRALVLHGDRSGALGEYAAFVTRLREDLGTEPSVPCVALAERIRREREIPAPQAPAPDAARRRAPLVHRREQLNEIWQVWQRAHGTPTAALAMLVGDPGTGKTRLSDELAARMRLDGAVTVVIRAVESDLATPWSGLLGLARGGLLEAAGLAAAPAAALAWFAGHIEEWGDRFPALQKVAPAPEPARAFVEVLRAVVREQPVVLVVDDAVMVDRDSLLAIEAALRDLAKAPLFALLTIAARSTRPETEQLRARVGRDLEGIVSRLCPLDLPDIVELARWAVPSYGAVEIDRLARRVLKDSAGLPLLVVELLSAVADGLDLQRIDGAWPSPLRTLDDSMPGDLPEAVTGAIRVEFHRLSKTAQLVLTAAAVLEDRVTADRLARATGLDPSAVSAALDELEWTRWLTTEGRGYSFAAAVVRRVIDRDFVLRGQRQRFLDQAGPPPPPGV